MSKNGPKEILWLLNNKTLNILKICLQLFLSQSNKIHEAYDAWKQNLTNSEFFEHSKSAKWQSTKLILVRFLRPWLMLGVRTFFPTFNIFFCFSNFLHCGFSCCNFYICKCLLKCNEVKKLHHLCKTILFSAKPTHARLIMRLIPEQKSPQALQSQ